MAMGRWGGEQQLEMFVLTCELAAGPTHVFYERLNELLRDGGFDVWLETLCEDYYAEGGRPSIPPGVYFRMLFVGYFEDIVSQRGIAWRCSDSLSLRNFLRFALNETTPDHSSLSKIGDRLPVEVYEEVFGFVLKLVHEHGLLSGKTVGVDSTLIEANAAMKSIVRKESGEDWRAYLQRLAAAEGLELKTREELARFDKQRKKDGKKKTSNEEWESKTDGDSRIMKMKDGSTHLAYKAENAVDLDTGVILAAEITPGNIADSASVVDTLDVAIATVIDVTGEDRVQEAVADKGYCKLQTLSDCVERDIATTFSEPKVHGQRRWDDKPDAHKTAFDANHNRVISDEGKARLRQRGEVVERTFAHLCETGGSRRVTVRGMAKVKVWYQLRAAAHNLSLILRTLLGTGKPRSFSAALLALWKTGFSLRNVLWKLLDAIRAYRIPPNHETAAPTTIDWLTKLKLNRQSLAAKHTAFSTGC
jgi:transposase